MRVSAVEATIATLEAAVRDLEPATLSGDAARRVVEVAVRRGRGKAAAASAEAARHEAIRRTRSLRHWTDPDGVFRLNGRLLPEDGAELLAALEPLRARIFVEARAAGRREPYEAYLADALV